MPKSWFHLNTPLAKRGLVQGRDFHAFVWKYPSGNIEWAAVSLQPTGPFATEGKWVRVKFMEVEER